MSASGDSALALRLNRDLTERIERETQALIKNPGERRAGRIEAFQEVLKIIANPDVKQEMLRG